MEEQQVTAPEEMGFGDALAEVERIVQQLEAGQLDLEQSLQRYERGVSLLRACRGKLADAQQKVTMLIGELEAEDETDGGDAQ